MLQKIDEYMKKIPSEETLKRVKENWEKIENCSKKVHKKFERIF